MMNLCCSGLWTHWHVVLPLWMALWTILALFDASQSYLLLHVFVERPPALTMSLPEILYLSLAEWYIWAMLGPFLILFALRFPFDPQRRKAWLAVMVLLSLTFAAFKVAVDVPVQLILRRTWGMLHFENVFHLFAILFTARFLIYVLICWAILGVIQALDYYQKFRGREFKTTQLEVRLAQAQLQVLKMQLDPHFLFNTLNAISALIHQDVEVADRMLARLGDLLRLTLENAGTQEVSLRQELDFIGPYLEIQQSRLGSRLAIRVDIDPEAMDARVPNLVLQPLVENAIQHGIATRPEGGRIEISARRQDERLLLHIRDDGPGLRGACAPAARAASA